MDGSYRKLLIVALVGVILIVNGVIPIVPSSLPSSSIPSVNSPPSTSSPTGIYGYGNKYRVNLHKFQTPNRIQMTSSVNALLIFNKGLLKMREQGIMTHLYSANRDDALVNEYKALTGGDKVYKIQHTLDAEGIKKFECVTFGYYRQRLQVTGMTDTACKPL